MSFFETKRQFSSTFAALSSVMKDNSSVLFHPKRYIGFRRKEPIKSKYSDFQLLAWKLTKFFVIFETTCQFSLKFCVTFQCMTHNSSKNFLADTLRFGQKEPIEVQIFRFLSALMKVQPVLKPQGQGLFKFCITVQCHEI